LLGAKVPLPFRDGWRVFYTQQHGDNVTRSFAIRIAVRIWTTTIADNLLAPATCRR
jgi:hypothetical protein